jgi:hypothetical protein
MKAQPHWNVKNKANRLHFARQHQTWNLEWKRVLFSDEKKFNLDGPDGFKHYWHCNDDNFKSYSKRQCGGNSIMIWGCFGYGGKLKLQLIKGRANAVCYQNLLETARLRDNGYVRGGGQFILQQDNAPIHRVCIVIAKICLSCL